MNEFTKLRDRARARRDQLIAGIRADYEAALVQIARLEQDLCGKETRRLQHFTTSMDSVIPKDRPFTAQDILAALEAMDPSRVWRKHAIDGHIFRLRERGVLRRIRKAKGRELALYVRVGVDVPKLAFEGMTMFQVVRAVLTEPMTPTEVCVAMREQGYDSTMDPGSLRTHVRRLLKERPEFAMDEGGKWRVT